MGLTRACRVATNQRIRESMDGEAASQAGTQLKGDVAGGELKGKAGVSP